MATGSAERVAVFGLNIIMGSNAAMTVNEKSSFALGGQGVTCVWNAGSSRVKFHQRFVLDHRGLQAQIVGKRTLRMVTGTKLFPF